MLRLLNLNKCWLSILKNSCKRAFLLRFKIEETCSTYMCHMSFDNSSSSMIHTFLLCNSATFPTSDNVFRCCPKWNKTTGIFRTLSNIYDGAFSRRRRLPESSIINVWHGTEAVVQKCSVKKVFLEIWQNLPVSGSLFPATL